MENLVDDGRLLAAVARVDGPGRRRLEVVVGRQRRGRRQPAAADVLFDLASLTKPFVATLALALDATGELPLDSRLREVWPRTGAALGDVTLERLLRHRAGFRRWTPLYARFDRRSEVIEALLSGDLLGTRPGTYSDLDYLLWGLTAERATGRPLFSLLRDRVAGPLGMAGVRAAPVPASWAVSCPLDNARERELAAGEGIALEPEPAPLPGRVQDGNATFLNRMCGHAGLFAAAEDVAVLAREWLRPTLLAPQAVAAALAGSSPYALGWERGRARNSAGPALGEGAFGHDGFTGGSVWIAPDADVACVLLAHRTGLDVDMGPVRRELHALAV